MRHTARRAYGHAKLLVKGNYYYIDITTTCADGKVIQGFAFDDEMDFFMRKAAVILSDFHPKKNVSW